MTNYFFNINGLTVGNHSFDPCATVDLLVQMGLIEDFSIDHNGEPVILYCDPLAENCYGYTLWFDFIKSFRISQQLADLILASLINRQIMNQVENLLNVAA